MSQTLQPLLRQEAFRRLPELWPDDPLPAIRRAVRQSQRTLVVLDDDPTGTQTVQDVPVLTEWSVECLEHELSVGTPLFFVLTNSRSLPPPAARALVREIAENLTAAGVRARRDFAVVSRSDSTLRGHFPLEMDVLATSSTWARTAPWILAPFFEAGGRVTIDDVHYVADGDRLIPAHLTPFARDPAFGYKSSNLREWIAEKTGGRIPADAVASISIDTLRREGPAGAHRMLATLPPGSVCIVNAAVQRDLEVFVQGLLQAEAGGRRFLYRTAASFVAARAGCARSPLLQARDLPLGPAAGGLFVVGSHVPKTTEQLQILLAGARLAGIEVEVERLLAPRTRAAEILRVTEAANTQLAADATVVILTSRQLKSAATEEANLQIGQLISNALVAIVQAVTIRPRYVVAKGGITSSDIATRALGVKRAHVRGQILPGVPVWQTGPESRWPDLTYVVFPGNVGDRYALLELARALEFPSRKKASPKSSNRSIAPAASPS